METMPFNDIAAVVQLAALAILAAAASFAPRIMRLLIADRVARLGMRK